MSSTLEKWRQQVLAAEPLTFAKVTVRTKDGRELVYTNVALTHTGFCDPPAGGEPVASITFEECPPIKHAKRRFKKNHDSFVADLLARLSAAGDRRDSEACDQIEAELHALGVPGSRRELR